MTDLDALLRAIAAHPDDDTPRLVYADFLEENGEADRAAFVRAQVEAARVPDWEPFPVFCRHRKPVWFSGQPWIRNLPPLADPNGWYVEWVTDPRPPFRRGLGWAVRVRSLPAWEAVAPRLFEVAPVAELFLRPAATLDDLRRFAAADWMRRARVVHLEGGSPVEPVRALYGSHTVTGLTDIHFHKATSTGMSFVVEDLLRSPLAESLRGLHFRMGYESLEDLIDSLTPDSGRFVRLSLAVMGLTDEVIRRWCDRGGPRGLVELDLRDNPLGPTGMRELARGLAGGSLTTLGLTGVKPGADGIEALAGCESLGSVRRLDLGSNPLPPKAVLILSRAWPLRGVRALGLNRCGIGDKGVRHLTRAKFWPNLVELDLRGNPIATDGVRHLLLAPPAPDLTALLLDGSGLGVDSRASLRQRFGDAVVFEG